MPAYSQIQTFVRCNNKKFASKIKDFKSLIKEIGFDEDYRRGYFDNVTWDIEDGGFVYFDSANFNRLDFSNLSLDLSPYLAGWSPEAVKGLKEPWLELALVFKTREI